MASKTTRKANAAAKKGKGSNIPEPKDDGTRWIVVDHETDEQVYPGPGVMRSTAEYLGRGLQRMARLTEVTPS